MLFSLYATLVVCHVGSVAHFITCQNWRECHFPPHSLRVFFLLIPQTRQHDDSLFSLFILVWCEYVRLCIVCLCVLFCSSVRLDLNV